MAVGLYRDAHGWVVVSYQKHTMPMAKSDYEKLRYEPEFDKLPTKAEYEASKTADRS